MARNYLARFGVRAIPVISSYPRTMACPPGVAPDQERRSITIGMAGQFYAAAEWLQLLATLEAVNWTVYGSRVNIVCMGPARPPAIAADHVTFLGWKPQSEAVKLLAGFDLLYCPYPFDPAMEEVARLSFPSKLVLYLAAGRPVIFHGPAYSSVAQYITGKGCGVLTTSLSAANIVAEIERLMGDRRLYAEQASNANKAFVEDFTLDSMARAFHDFIGADAPDVVTLHDHARSGEGESYPDRLPRSIDGVLLSLLIKCGRLARKVSKRLLRGSEA
jgi:glycosyltransferase involved in cell wall biosynthesis